MGTRNLTAVMIDGEYKVAQYAQWDGYPSKQGATILDFLSKDGNIQRLREALGRVRFLEPDGKDKDALAEYEKNAPEWSNEPDNRTPEQKRWFTTYISRDIGGKILETIATSSDEEMVLKNVIGFAGDSLMCEYAYVVDLDKNTFEIYEGFNKEPIDGARFNSSDEFLERQEGYEPVKLIKEYRLNNLPTLDKFLEDLEPQEDEKEE